MLVADLHHFLDLTADTPGPARRLGEHLASIVAAATAGDAGTAWESALPCRRRPANRPCPGRIIVICTQPDTPIGWQCSRCGDDGTISNWADTPYDLRRQQLAVAEPLHAIVLEAEIAAAFAPLLSSTPIAREQYSPSAHTTTVFISQSPTPNSTN